MQQQEAEAQAPLVGPHGSGAPTDRAPAPRRTPRRRKVKRRRKRPVRSLSANSGAFEVVRARRAASRVRRKRHPLPKERSGPILSSTPRRRHARALSGAAAGSRGEGGGEGGGEGEGEGDSEEPQQGHDRAHGSTSRHSPPPRDPTRPAAPLTQVMDPCDHSSDSSSSSSSSLTTVSSLESLEESATVTEDVSEAEPARGKGKREAGEGDGSKGKKGLLTAYASILPTFVHSGTIPMPALPNDSSTSGTNTVAEGEASSDPASSSSAVTVADPRKAHMLASVSGARKRLSPVVSPRGASPGPSNAAAAAAGAAASPCTDAAAMQVLGRPALLASLPRVQDKLTFISECGLWASLVSYVRDNMCSEVLSSWLCCCRVSEAQDEEERRQGLRELWDTFVSDSAEQAIVLPSRLRRKLEAALEPGQPSPSASLMSQLQQEIAKSLLGIVIDFTRVAFRKRSSSSSGLPQSPSSHGAPIPGRGSPVPHGASYSINSSQDMDAEVLFWNAMSPGAEAGGKGARDDADSLHQLHSVLSTSNMDVRSKLFYIREHQQAYVLWERYLQRHYCLPDWELWNAIQTFSDALAHGASLLHMQTLTQIIVQQYVDPESSIAVTLTQPAISAAMTTLDSVMSDQMPSPKALVEVENEVQVILLSHLQSFVIFLSTYTPSPCSPFGKRVEGDAGMGSAQAASASSGEAHEGRTSGGVLMRGKAKPTRLEQVLFGPAADATLLARLCVIVFRAELVGGSSHTKADYLEGVDPHAQPDDMDVRGMNFWHAVTAVAWANDSLSLLLQGIVRMEGSKRQGLPCGVTTANHVTTKMFWALQRCQKFAHRVLKQGIDSAMQWDGYSQEKPSMHHVAQCASMVMDNLLSGKAYDRLSPVYRQALRTLYQVSPGTEESRRRLIGSLLIQALAPAVLSPDRYGFVRSVVEFDKKRQLMSVLHVMRRIAANAKYDPSSKPLRPSFATRALKVYSDDKLHARSSSAEATRQPTPLHSESSTSSTSTSPIHGDGIESRPGRNLVRRYETYNAVIDTYRRPFDAFVAHALRKVPLRAKRGMRKEFPSALRAHALRMVFEALSLYATRLLSDCEGESTFSFLQTLSSGRATREDWLR